MQTHIRALLMIAVAALAGCGQNDSPQTINGTPTSDNTKPTPPPTSQINAAKLQAISGVWTPSSKIPHKISHSISIQNTGVNPPQIVVKNLTQLGSYSKPVLCPFEYRGEILSTENLYTSDELKTKRRARSRLDIRWKSLNGTSTERACLQLQSALEYRLRNNILGMTVEFPKGDLTTLKVLGLKYTK